MHFCCCWDRASHWIMLVLNSWSSLLPLPYNSTLNLVTFPGLITCSLVARDHRFCLPSNSEKILTDGIIQWFLHHEKHHLDWSSQCAEHIRSNVDKKILYPFSKGRKQDFERIIYLARSQGANCQNSNSNLKPQAPKSWPPHNAAWTVVQEPWHSEPPVNNWNHSKGMESKFTYEFHSY